LLLDSIKNIGGIKMGRKFGWRSGTVYAKDGKFSGDVYIQDDLTFSDVSAGALSVTGGIDMQSTTSAIGIDLGGTYSTSAINIDGTGIDARALMIGTKDTGLQISTGAGLDAEPANNYLFGLFSKVSEDESTSDDELRSCWIRTRIDDDITIGTATGWGFGVCGAEIQLKSYGATINSWQASALWAQLESQGTTTTFASGCYGSCVLANVGLTATTVIASGAVVAGVIINSNTAASGVTATGGFYGLYITQKTAGLLDFTSGIYIAADSCTVGIDVNATTGIDIGTCTTGIDFTGTYTGNCIDFTDVTIDHTGSNGPCLIRAGTYASPLANADEDQSGLIRLYMETSADGTSYDRGIFVCLKTTGIKGIFPISGLAEVLAQSGNGPSKVQACQFIAHLNSPTAKLAALGGDSAAGMYGGWFKITANEGATTAAGSRAAPIWLDNQLYGANINASMEEYTIFSRTGGSQPKAWAGFETTSSGWDQLLYFDETMAAAEPFVATGCTIAEGDSPYLKVLVNATQYGIPLVAI